LEKNKILFVNTHFPPDYHYGGVLESGSKIYKYLRKIDKNITYAVVSKIPDKVYAEKLGSGMCYTSIQFHRFGFSFDLIFGLWRQISENDIVFINGTVTFPTVLAQIYAVLLRKKFIVSTRGTFGQQSIQQKKWKKYFYYIS